MMLPAPWPSRGEVGASLRRVSVKGKLRRVQHLTWLVHLSTHLAGLPARCSVETHHMVECSSFLVTFPAPVYIKLSGFYINSDTI